MVNADINRAAPASQLVACGPTGFYTIRLQDAAELVTTQATALR